MTFPAPARRYAYAFVLPAIRHTGGYVAACACGETFSTHPTLDNARNAAHTYAVRCPLAAGRSLRYQAMRQATA